MMSFVGSLKHHQYIQIYYFFLCPYKNIAVGGCDVFCVFIKKSRIFVL